MALDIRYTFEAVHDGTLAVGNFDARPGGAMKVLLPLLMPVTQRRLTRQHATFIRLSET